ncbi:MAG TPA: alpha/beta hydrolase [Thermoanaerobaculia bacterium]|nr:alpha/beta hydrolase [Thermoanaerobaculia bacterium]
MPDPAAAFAQALRSALPAAGLERRALDGTIYFTSADDSGPRTPMVLVHGANDHAGTWAPVVPRLLDRYRLIIPDLAGHGESAPTEGPIYLSAIVDGLAAVIDRETSGPVILVGNSMGAWVAMLYALANRQRVSRLVLESGGGLARPLGVPLIATTPEEAIRILRAVHGPDAVLPDWAPEALMRRAQSSPLLRVMQSGAFEHLVDDRLGDLRVPTTVIWGEHDGVVPRDYVNALRDGIAGARLEVIAGAAHIPHLQQPERFVACLTATS